MSNLPPDQILVIDEIPLIAAGLRELLRSIQRGVSVEHTDNHFTALSANSWAGKQFDLIVIGNFRDGFSAGWQKTVTELKQRFGQPLIMIYSGEYDPLIIEKMGDAGIDAYVHKHEPIEEIVRAWQHLSAGKPFVSGMFHTIYHDYGYRPEN